MERLLLFVKHNLKFLWELVEWTNGFLFSIIYQARLNKVISYVFSEYVHPHFAFRRLSSADMESLAALINTQPLSDLIFFRPHDFDIRSLNRQTGKRGFLMMGAFDNQKMIGYFFLRFFINRKCFVGRLTDSGYRSIGIGKVMNRIMYETAWRMNFRCLSTISKNNANVINAHSKNNAMIWLKDLRGEYMLVEFVKEGVLSNSQK